jgi:desumoylating isopeptidase 1
VVGEEPPSKRYCRRRTRHNFEAPIRAWRSNRSGAVATGSVVNNRCLAVFAKLTYQETSPTGSPTRLSANIHWSQDYVSENASLPPTMEVQLYVYDLTHGLARQMSRQLLGTHIDAVYHTALVFGGIEYFFGAGVQTCYPGTTHHGQPMEIIPLGTTQLPLETILEYLEGLEEIYTPETYDLFAKNCNHFTNDFAMFLVGRGIPEHITSLPERVLETPFGQMLKPQLDASMRQVTQAPVAPQNVPVAHRPATSSVANGQSSKAVPFGNVINITTLSALEKRLQSASQTAATIFFTSSTCAPCKLAYPTFDQLAEEYPQALFVKVDINQAHDVAMRYQIRATPTFMTFSRGAKVNEWQGADPNLLKANVERLMNQTFLPHPHTTLKVPTLQFGSLKPVTYAKVPPLDKLMTKLGEAGKDLNLVALRTFLEKRSHDPREATLQTLAQISRTFRGKVLSLPVEKRFAAIDLLRCAMIDPRVSGYFAEEKTDPVVPSILEHVNQLQDCPHNLRLVTIHLACNLFASSLYVQELLKPGNATTKLIVQLVTSSLLDASHPTTRVASASLAFNLAATNYLVRREEGREGLAESEQVELAASLLETLGSEENADASKAMLLAIGYLVYCSPMDGEVMDLSRALDAKATVTEVKGHSEGLGREVGSLL